MSVFSRVTDILAANLNALLDRAEDPEAALAQVIRAMADGLERVRHHAAIAIAAERGLRREIDEHHKQAEHWKGRAREALSSGREDLARQALARNHDHAALAATLEERHAEAQGVYLPPESSRQ